VTAPVFRWAVSPHDGYCHAFDPAQTDGATERGHPEAVCGHTIGARLILSEAPCGTLCASCAMAVAPEVADRATLIRSARPTLIRTVRPRRLAAAPRPGLPRRVGSARRRAGGGT